MNLKDLAMRPGLALSLKAGDALLLQDAIRAVEVRPVTLKQITVAP